MAELMLHEGDLVRKKVPDSRMEARRPGMIYLGSATDPGIIRCLAVGSVLRTVEVPMDEVEEMPVVKRNYIRVVRVEEDDD